MRDNVVSSRRTRWPVASRYLRDLAQAAHSWLGHEGPRLAASLSFYSLLSLAPLVIVSIAIASFAVGRGTAEGALVNEVGQVMGDDGAHTIHVIIQHARTPHSVNLASAIGVIVLLFGASGVFGELQSGLNKIWDAKPSPGLGLLALVKSRLVSFALVVAFGFLLLISLVFSAVVTAFSRFFSDHVPLPHVVLVLTNALLSFAGIFFLLGLILRYIPDVPLSWSDVWEGALATALLFAAGKTLFGLYLGTAAVASAYGAAGSLIVVILWVYYSAMIFYFGAALTRVRARTA